MVSSDDDEAPAEAGQSKDIPPAPQVGGEEQPHQQIEIFFRLQNIPFINWVLRTAILGYTAGRNSSPIMIQNILVAAEITITKATVLALVAMGQQPILLAADRLACSALDWLNSHNFVLTSTTQQAVQDLTTYFQMVKEAFFSNVEYYISVLVPSCIRLRQIIFISRDSFCFGVSTMLHLILPTSVNVAQHIQNIRTSYSHISRRVAVFFGHLSTHFRSQVLMEVHQIAHPTENPPDVVHPTENPPAGADVAGNLDQPSTSQHKQDHDKDSNKK